MLALANDPDAGGRYFVLNSSLKEIFSPVLKDSAYFNLANDGKALAKKQIIMLDERSGNQQLAGTYCIITAVDIFAYQLHNKYL